MAVQYKKTEKTDILEQCRKQTLYKGILQYNTNSYHTCNGKCEKRTFVSVTSDFVTDFITMKNSSPENKCEW